MKTNALIMAVASAILLIFSNSCSHNVDIPTPEDEAGELAGLEPKNVFKYFEKICRIPRASYNTKEISDWVVDFAKKHSLNYYQDSYNNVVIYVDASKDKESLEPLAIQVHLDMVSISTDPANEPALVGVKPKTDGQYVWAEGTSLGADNGCGIAMVLSILDEIDELPHPTLELIFTVDEEVGMMGAEGLDKSVLKSKRMLNFDDELENECIVSSASGRSLKCLIPSSFKALSGYDVFEVEINGLLGGHSGDFIHLGRANANIVIAELIQPLVEPFHLRMAEFNGGTVENAITESCNTVVAVPLDLSESFYNQLNSRFRQLIKKYTSVEPYISFGVQPKKDVAKALDEESTKRIIDMLCNIPDGMQMKSTIAEMAAVSLNIGKAALEEDGFHFSTLIRSNLQAEVEPLYNRFVSCVSEYGGSSEITSDCPAWDYCPESPIRDIVMSSYLSVLGWEPEINLTHCCIESSIFVLSIPGLDVTSIGPTIFDAHTVKERIEVASVGRLYAVLKEIIKRSSE